MLQSVLKSEQKPVDMCCQGNIHKSLCLLDMLGPIYNNLHLD